MTKMLQSSGHLFSSLFVSIGDRDSLPVLPSTRKRTLRSFLICRPTLRTYVLNIAEILVECKLLRLRGGSPLSCVRRDDIVKCNHSNFPIESNSSRSGESNTKHQLPPQDRTPHSPQCVI